MVVSIGWIAEMKFPKLTVPLAVIIFRLLCMDCICALNTDECSCSSPMPFFISLNQSEMSVRLIRLIRIFLRESSFFTTVSAIGMDAFPCL